MSDNEPTLERDQLRERVARLEGQLAEYDHLFDLQRSRMQEATALWQREMGQPDLFPDLGNLLAFLIVRAEAQRDAIAALVDRGAALHREYSKNMQLDAGMRELQKVRAEECEGIAASLRALPASGGQSANHDAAKARSIFLTAWDEAKKSPEYTKDTWSDLRAALKDLGVFV